jgi:spore germination protein YaaH
MKILKILITAIILCTSLYSQEDRSVMYQDYLQYGSKTKQKSFFKSSGEDIIPLVNKKNDLKAVVYGYFPDWEYNYSRSYLDYTLLTHISVFEFDVTSSGSLTYPSYWPWTDVINTAHANGVKIILTAVNFTTATIHTILTDVTVKQNFFNNVKNVISTYKLDGVNVDFEGIGSADKGTILNGFMKDLANFIHTELPGKEVSFAAPALTSGWNIAELANACDYLFIMGYDFYGSWSTITGPSAPYSSISGVVNTQYASVTKSNPGKLILGVPYYGQKWITYSDQPYSSIKSYVGSTRFYTDVVNAPKYGILWSKFYTPWYKYQENGEWYQVWYDNDSSLGLKFQLAQSNGYKGVGMWALGYDRGRKELWDELRRRFASNIYSISGIVNDTNGIPLPGVNITMTGSVNSVMTTLNDGKYNFIVPKGGTYTLTPQKMSYSFTPAGKVFENIDTNIVQNFTAKFLTNFITGSISYLNKPFSGVNVRLSGDAIDSSITDTQGQYKFTVGRTGSYTMTPEKQNYSFLPLKHQLFNLNNDTIMDFTASLNTYTLSGIIYLDGNRLSGVKIYLSGDKNDSSITTQMGIYIYIVNAGGNYKITPYKENYTFTPAEKIYTNLSDGQIFSFNATLKTSSTKDDREVNITKSFELRNNYPNPFNPATIISYEIPVSAFVSIKIYDVHGREVETLISKQQPAGSYNITFNAKNLTSGVYYYKLSAGKYAGIKKMVLMK